MNVTFAKIYNTNYIRVSHDSSYIYLPIIDAEQRWQELMAKCQEYLILQKASEPQGGVK